MEKELSPRRIGKKNPANKRKRGKKEKDMDETVGRGDETKTC